MKTFFEWLEGVQGFRGIGPGEMRQAVQGDYRSPTMKSGDVYYDTDPDAHTTATNYVHQGGGGDPRLGATQKSAGRGYVMGVDAPEDVAHKPDFQTDTGQAHGPESYRAVPAMQQKYVSTVQSVRPNPQGPIQLGGMSISRPPLMGKVRDGQKFIQTYQRMFGNQPAQQTGPSQSPTTAPVS